MFDRITFGLCCILLAGFLIKEYWKAQPVSPYTVVGAPQAHAQSLDGKGVVVAVLDEGFDTSHKLLKDKFNDFHRYNTTSKKNSDTSESIVFENGKYAFESHGTHVSGIISTVAPQVSIIPIKLGSLGGDQDFVKALQLAADSPAHVVNISMRLSHTGREVSPNVRDALLHLAQAGKLIVIAAGNESANMMRQAYTASLVELSHDALMMGRLLLVGASSYKNGVEDLAEFSNFPGNSASAMAQTYFITAPGDQVQSTITGGKFGEKSGTSMAAPMVVGAASLVKQAHPQLSAEGIAQVLLSSARKVTLDGKALPHSKFGAGILNLQSALEQRG